MTITIRRVAVNPPFSKKVRKAFFDHPGFYPDGGLPVTIPFADAEGIVAQQGDDKDLSLLREMKKKAVDTIEYLWPSCEE